MEYDLCASFTQRPRIKRRMKPDCPPGLIAEVRSRAGEDEARCSEGPRCTLGGTGGHYQEEVVCLWRISNDGAEVTQDG